MNINDIYTQLLYSTAPISVENVDGTNVEATAFFYMFYDENKQNIPFLITNYHVIERAKRIYSEFFVREGNLPSKTNKVTVELNLPTAKRYSSPELDLVAIPIGHLINQLENTSTPIFIRAITSDLVPSLEQINQLSAVENVKYIGYQKNLSKLLPLVRGASTSTPVWSNYNDKKAFLIDSNIMPGVSGSPVFIASQGMYSENGGIVLGGNRVMFLGVVSAGLPNSLGLVLNSELIDQFLHSVVINKST
ncbi:hypothetical protein PTW35_08720 [Photobacterium sp. DA100]|uniref:hypothetical protein n=1 Tax=Photobacterium sp. DA100 TaxID=3027472 RepID=UPI00247AF3E1|nr:hypothetical protein [Photobacterium sp. DA100]WEM43841.1 hypothetical protein PTW35_08720 [Photobacterium sp. DA100]